MPLQSSDLHRAPRLADVITICQELEPILNNSGYLHQAHDPKYVERFCSGALDGMAMKRIGFGEITRSPVLVERTLAEIAGAGLYRICRCSSVQEKFLVPE